EILFLAVSINGIVNAIKSIFIKRTFAKVMAIIMLILFIATLGITSIVFSN
ncbi:putative membrane protein, partial [Chlamydia psittaci 02DC14]